MNIGKGKTEERIFHAPPPTPPRTVGFVPVIAEIPTKRKVSCNCKNSRCIKLYCECFRNETFCKDCNCECCLNKTDNPTRKNTIAMIKQKNPSAFEPKFKPNKERFRSFVSEPKTDVVGNPLDVFIEISRGCNCKNSNCRKKYCECFQYGIECSAKCKCENCLNGNCGKRDDNNGHQINMSNFYNIEETELKRILIEKILAIKHAKFPKPR